MIKGLFPVFLNLKTCSTTSPSIILPKSKTSSSNSILAAFSGEIASSAVIGLWISEELEIFSRQLILDEFNFKDFKKLQNKNISIIGIGGIGCPTAQYLISSGIKNLQIFDQDIIKKHNLNRQTLFSIHDIGKKKSITAKKKLKGINPLANIKSYHRKISSDNLNLNDLK